jgi:CRP-like cAMP-binding protein/CheY-specific phosphatase CheX
MEDITFRQGEVIVNEGEHSSDLYTLKSGRIAVFKGTKKIAEIDKAGSFIGEMSFFLGEERSATMIALTEVTVGKVSKQSITSQIQSNPGFAMDLSLNLSEKLNQTNKKLTELKKYKDLYDRILRVAESNDAIKDIISESEKAMEEKDKQVKDMLTKESLLSKKIIDPLMQATINSVNQMIRTNTIQLEPFEFHEKEIQIDAASIIDFIGDLDGWYIMGFSKEVAIKMTKAITGTENPSLNEEVIAFIKEINNVIIGWIISYIKEYHLNISTPTMVFGNSSINNMIGDKPCVVIPFSTDLGDFYTITYLEFMK